MTMIASIDETGALILAVEDFLLHAPIIPNRGDPQRYLDAIGGEITQICAAAGLSVRVVRYEVEQLDDQRWQVWFDVSGHTLTQAALDDLATHFQQQIVVDPAPYGWQRLEFWV